MVLLFHMHDPAHGWKLIFKGGGGMASLLEEENAHMHGVVHLMTSDEMKVCETKRLCLLHSS